MVRELKISQETYSLAHCFAENKGTVASIMEQCDPWLFVSSSGYEKSDFPFTIKFFFETELPENDCSCAKGIE